MKPHATTVNDSRLRQIKDLMKVARNSMSALMSLLVAAQPIMAQTANIVADDTGTTVYEAGNGVTTVDIATPNSAGLSQNTYTDFNVGNGGAILNNSNAVLDRSQLGGLLQGNGNLATSGPARVILNEVTGSGRSVLEGALEIHGASADVIVANPNGITCDGCGFINTPRVTLSTGRAQIGANGALAGFAVNGGDVLIGENGADARSTTIFDLVSRRISLQGPIVAGGDLGLAAGHNDFDYGNRTATSRGSDGKASAIAIDSALLGGMYAGRISVLSTDTGSGVNMQGQMASNTGEMTLTADGRLVMGQVQARGPVRATSKSSVVHAARTIYSDDAITLQGLTAVEIAESALVASQTDVTLDGVDITLETGAIAAAGVTNAGVQTQNGTLSLSGTRIDAGKGTLAAGAEITLDAVSVDLSRDEEATADTVRSLGDVVITTEMLDATNSQVRASDTLTLSSDDDLTINGGDFAAMGALDLTGDGITTSASLGTQGTATIRATTGSVTNTGRIAGDDQTALTAQTDVNNRGDLISQTGVMVTAGATLNNTANGQIIGSQTTTQSQSLDNAGLIAAQGGNLAITTDEALGNDGTLVAAGTLAISSDGDLTNGGQIVGQNAVIISGQNGVAAGVVNNLASGLVNGGGVLTLNANSLDNAGGIGAASGALNIDLAGNLTNTGLLYSGTASNYRLDGDFANTNADIIAETNLTITGLTGARAGDLLNSSGTIEAIAGDISIAANSITNRRPAPTILEFSTTQVTGSDRPKRPSRGHTNSAKETTSTTSVQVAEHSGVAAQILAGGHMALDATMVTNDYSQIAANGDVTIVANDVTNTGRDLVETIDTKVVTHYWRRSCRWSLFGACIGSKGSLWDTTATSRKSATVGAEFGSIQAGGRLNAVIGGYLENDAVRDGADQVGLSSGDRALTAVDAVALSGESLSGLAISIDTILDRGALFDPASDPNATYLIETRPEFIQLSNFLGSDYFLDQVGGHNLDQTMRRFGDAYIETRLIRDQIFGQTGARYLDGLLDEMAQMRALYDNAIIAQRDLNLSIGVALTPDQIAALTSDIVWLEPQIIQGQNVLVPRLYLSQATLTTIDLNSARISGGQTEVVAGAIGNSGAISGETGLQLRSGSIFANTGGSLFSSADISVNAGTIFANQSGRIIAGDDVSITAETVFNNTEKTRDEELSGYADRAQQTARIEAGGNIQIDATGSIGSVGGEFVAGDAITITGADNIEITALALETNRDEAIDGGYYRKSGLTNNLANIAAGSDLKIKTDGDLTLRGVDASAGGNAVLTADGSVNIASVQDVENSDLKLDLDSGGIFGVETNIRQQDAAVDTLRTVIAVNGGLTITANTRDITVDAATLQSGDETRLSAAGEVALRTETDSTFQQDYLREEDLFWWNERDQGQSAETIEMVEVHADGGFTIDAGAGIIIEYQAHENLDDALTTISSQPGLEWMGDMRTNPDVDWKQIEAVVQEWDYQDQGLTEAGALFVTAVVTYATGGTGGFVDTLASNLATSMGVASNTAMYAAIQAGVGNLVTQSSVALVNNQGDLGGTLEQLVSEDGFKSLATAMISAGFATNLTNAAGLGDFDPAEVTAMENTVHRLKTGFINSTVNAIVSTSINGGDIGDNLTDGWTNAMVMAGLAGVQHRIGDFGNTHELPDGSLPKILAHAVAGGLASEALGGSFADGAMAGALAEITSDVIGGRIPGAQDQIELQRLVATSVILLANGGDATSAGLAASIAASAHENNYLKHDQVAQMSRDIEACFADSGCDVQDVFEDYATLSKTNRDAMAACTTLACWEEHRQEIIASNKMTGQLAAAAYQEGIFQAGINDQLASGFAREENLESGVYLIAPDQTVAGLNFEAFGEANCGGTHNAACLSDFNSAMRQQNMQDAAIGTLEIATPYGLVVDGYDCATSGSLASCATAAASVLPTGAIVRFGGELFVNTAGGLVKGALRQTDTGVEAVTTTGQTVRVATNTGIDGIWDRGQFTPIQRGNLIEDHLSITDYSGWTRVGAQNNGFSPAFDFNQGSTWVSLKTLDTGGSGWQTGMQSHIRELQTWSSPNPNATKVLDIRVQPGGAASAQSLVDYGASRGVQVRINEF